MPYFVAYNIYLGFLCIQLLLTFFVDRPNQAKSPETTRLLSSDELQETIHKDEEGFNSDAVNTTFYNHGAIDHKTTVYTIDVIGYFYVHFFFSNIYPGPMFRFYTVPVYRLAKHTLIVHSLTYLISYIMLITGALSNEGNLSKYF